VAIAFDHALADADSVVAKEARGPFERVADVWGAQCFYRGRRDIVRGVALQNLMRIAREPGFSSFQIYMRDSCVVRINAFFPEYFVPVQLWKVGKECFANGNSDFCAIGDLAGDPGLREQSVAAVQTSRPPKPALPIYPELLPATPGVLVS
jgi:hypothetical protein